MSKGLVPALRLACALMLGGVAVPVTAQVVTSVQVTNTYGFSTGGQAFDDQPGGPKETFVTTTSGPGSSSEVGIDYTGIADLNSFFFLHNDYCVGNCTAVSSTEIVFTLQNLTNAPLDLRFDSLITPGHLGRVTGDPRAIGGFDFYVSQGSVAASEEPEILYSAFGNVNDEDVTLDTGGLTFANLDEQSGVTDGRAWRTIDWGATNLNIDLLTIGAGETTFITYSAFYYVSLISPCDDVLSCPGIQVVFGDPRNNGTVGAASARGFSAMAMDEEELEPVVGRQFDPYQITANFVLQGSPLPGDPEGIGPVTYGPLFRSPGFQNTAVPEPATWAMLIAGFALVGGAVRRRRPIAA